MESRPEAEVRFHHKGSWPERAQGPPPEVWSQLVASHESEDLAVFGFGWLRNRQSEHVPEFKSLMQVIRIKPCEVEPGLGAMPFREAKCRGVLKHLVAKSPG